MAIQAPPEIESAYQLGTQSAVIVEPQRSFLEVGGPDAVEFVQGQVTNNVAALAPGEGCYALLLNPKGRILADMRILMRNPEELWVDAEPPAMEVIASNLNTYKIGRQVQVSPISVADRDIISLIGARSREITNLNPAQREHAFVEGELNGARVLGVATDVGVDLIFDTRDVALIEDAIYPRLTLDDSAVSMGLAERIAEILRIERGRPRFGIDMTSDNLPGELGLEERAVSFTKGCYVGQEPVARMHHRGHPNRHLRGLALTRPAQTGDPVTKPNGEAGSAGGAEAGRVGSACVSPVLGPIALAVLRREVEPGEQVLIGGDAPATVVRLPFEGA